MRLWLFLVFFGAVYGSPLNFTAFSRDIRQLVPRDDPCGFIGNGGLQRLSPTKIMICLNSFPFDEAKAVAFLDYVVPMIDMQSTITYLKKPPAEYMLPPVDILGGISEMRLRIQKRYYKKQYHFESDLHWLINVAPHDGHLRMPLPLVSAFGFGTDLELVSVSSDGTSKPEVYMKSDSTHHSKNASSIESISGESVSDYIERSSQSLIFSDPDALYNAMFCKLPLGKFCGGQFGLSLSRIPATDTEQIKFKDGTSKLVQNYGVYLGKYLENYKSSSSQINRRASIPVKLQKRATYEDSLSFDLMLPLQEHIPEARVEKTERTPVVLHSSKKMAGYFLNDSETAVLTISSFGNEVEAIAQQQIILKDFLGLCASEGKKRLIIDLRGNSGGSIFGGYDTFKQLFPMKTPYGATRYRLSSFIDYIGSVISASTIDLGLFSFRRELRENLETFTHWKEVGKPNEIHGDNFTELVRWNLNYPSKHNGEGITVSGYGDRQLLPEQVFDPENMVVLHDGYCASMCSLFSEFLKIQAGVRSISIGGRPQETPMQGLGATKGAQVLNYGYIINIRNNLNYFIGAAKWKGKSDSIHAEPPPELMPPRIESLHGISAREMIFNFRNNYRERDATQTPRQFAYEASNCRLFYTRNDMQSAIPLWERVRDTAWRNGTCVAGSTTNADHTISTSSLDTVPFKDEFKSKIVARAGLF